VSRLAGLSDAQFAGLAPVQWPVRREGEDSQRLFGDGRFLTPNGRARFVAIESGRTAAVREAWPFVLNTGRVRDQWHTMTRTGLSARLSAHVSEPFVEMHPDDAAALGLDQGMLARLETEHGTALLRVMLSDGQQPGSLFVPIHWSAQNSSGGRIGALVQPRVDPFSGQPDAKATPARIDAAQVSHYGFALSRRPVPTTGLSYWARARMPAGYVTAVALDEPPEGWSAWSRRLLPAGERFTYEDERSRQYRSAVLRDGRLEAALYVAPSPSLPSLEWLKTCFDLPAITGADRRSLLAGRLVGAADAGPIVCACFQIGRARIEGAVAAGASSVAEIGAATRAGTSCGSCVPELKRLVGTALVPVAAAVE
jgi:assimilatory nitrate reductase catalytic subunit